MFNFFKRSKPEPKKKKVTGDKVQLKDQKGWTPEKKTFELPQFAQITGTPDVASDSSMAGDIKSNMLYEGANAAQLEFFRQGSQFIGYQTCAMLATDWLIRKACNMPARDAIRKGYLLTCGDTETQKQLRKKDKKYKVNANMMEMINFGRVYGGRIVLFVVETANPDIYYENPFNLDGIEVGSYKGLSQIDPNWITPVLTSMNTTDPASQEYYNPTYWQIKGRKYHRSHLHIFVPNPVPDYLKPTYNFLGIPVPQMILESVYNAHRSANEAPQLLMTKRLLTVALSEGADPTSEDFKTGVQVFAETRDNYGIMPTAGGETVQQFDTALGDVDAVLMNNYQIVAAAAGVPATKMLGTAPKGFNSSGEYEDSVYREELESIQSNDLTDLLEKHYQCVAKSEGITPPEDIVVQWLPLDSPTALESSQIELNKANRDVALVNTGGIDGEDVRTRLKEDKDGDYANISDVDFVKNGETENSFNGQASEMGGAEGQSDIQGAAAELSDFSHGTVSGGTSKTD